MAALQRHLQDGVSLTMPQIRYTSLLVILEKGAFDVDSESLASNPACATSPISDHIHYGLSWLHVMENLGNNGLHNIGVYFGLM